MNKNSPTLTISIESEITTIETATAETKIEIESIKDIPSSIDLTVTNFFNPEDSVTTKKKENESVVALSTELKLEATPQILSSHLWLDNTALYQRTSNSLFLLIVSGVLFALVLIGTAGCNSIKPGKTLANINSDKAHTSTDATSNTNSIAVKKAAETIETTSKAILPKGVEMSFAYIPAGSFYMGSATNDNEKPIHQVKISQDFWIGQTEVTQRQWKALMKSISSKCDYGKLTKDFLGENKPVVCVSWDDAQSFVSKLNALNDGYKYRLPTEAEWEYVMHSGKTENHVTDSDATAWYKANSDEHSHDVASKEANAWNVYDMQGNVQEWCQDWYGRYLGGTVTDPKGSTTGFLRVIRGSSFSSLLLRPGDRSYSPPSDRNINVGFRVVRQKTDS